MADWKLGSPEANVTGLIIGAAIEVHRVLGPGLLERVYEKALAKELELCGLKSVRQVRIPISYKGEAFEEEYRADLLVEDKVVVEVKSVEAVKAVHCSQVLTYLRLSGIRVGLLLNFNEALLKDGITRLVT